MSSTEQKLPESDRILVLFVIGVVLLVSGFYLMFPQCDSGDGIHDSGSIYKVTRKSAGTVIYSRVVSGAELNREANENWSTLKKVAAPVFLFAAAICLYSGVHKLRAHIIMMRLEARCRSAGSPASFSSGGTGLYKWIKPLCFMVDGQSKLAFGGVS